MQAISELGTELVKNGYCKVLFVETYCPTHGAWRCAVAGSAAMISCPRCGAPHQAAHIGYGFTRKPNAWELWEAPLSGMSRLMMLAHEKQWRKKRHYTPPLRSRSIQKRALPNELERWLDLRPSSTSA